VRRAAAGFLVLCSAAIAASASTAGSGRTTVHYFHPFRDGEIASGVHVTRSARGYCWTTSNVESRRYAWRCFRGNYIHDPCFSSVKHARFVLCPTEPWSDDVLRLQLTRRLPRWQRSGYSKSLPVGVWTTTGKRCVHSSGATSEIGGRPITYTCAAGGLLVGLARRGTRIWTISFASSYRAKHLTRVGISDAWW
jgi:hypothetical protein